MSSSFQFVCEPSLPFGSPILEPDEQVDESGYREAGDIPYLDLDAPKREMDEEKGGKRIRVSV